LLTPREAAKIGIANATLVTQAHNMAALPQSP
jgi:hypothetical protein